MYVFVYFPKLTSSLSKSITPIFMSLIHVYEMIVSCRFDTKVWFPKYIEY